METLLKFKHVIDRILLIASLLLLVVMVFIIIYQVFSRELFSVTPAWSEELSRLLFVWVSFFGIAYGFKEKLHIGVGAVVNKFPDKVQDVFDYIAKIIVIGFGIIMMYYGWRFMMLMGYSTMPALGVPSSILYASIPFAGFFVTINGIELLFIKGMHQEYDDDASEG